MFNSNTINYIELKTQELMKISVKAKKAGSIQKIKLINAYIRIWSEFNDAFSNSVGGWRLIDEFIDPNNNDVATSNTLKIKYILCKQNGKLSKFSGTDKKLNYLKLNEIAEYSFWIIGSTLQQKQIMDLNKLFYYTFIQTCMIAYKAIDYTPMNITPALIYKIILKLKERIMKELTENKKIARPKIRTVVPCFTVDDPKAISKATGDYRQKKVIKWLADYFIAFKEEFERFPCIDEVQAYLQCMFNGADKDFKLFLKNGSVSRNTLYKWLDATDVRQLMTRKTKNLELHLQPILKENSSNDI